MMTNGISKIIHLIFVYKTGVASVMAAEDQYSAVKHVDALPTSRTPNNYHKS